MTTSVVVGDRLHRRPVVAVDHRRRLVRPARAFRTRNASRAPLIDDRRSCAGSFWASWAARSGTRPARGSCGLARPIRRAAPARLAGRSARSRQLRGPRARRLGTKTSSPSAKPGSPTQTSQPSPSGDPIRVEPVADDDVRLVALAACADPAEWSEASVDDPHRAATATSEGGEFARGRLDDDWYDTIAHSERLHRCHACERGLAGQVAAVAVASSLARWLIPQWRSRLGNDASVSSWTALVSSPSAARLLSVSGRM